MAELQSELLIIIKVGLCFSHYPAPLLLLRRHYSVNGLQSLVVKFSLYQKKSVNVCNSYIESLLLT